jgi:hypothetical protein
MTATDHPSAGEIADKLIALVEERWAKREPEGIAVRDVNDVFLLLGYTRAFRCFRSIRDLAADGRQDDAFVLLRSLVSVVLRSLYVAASDDADERELRQRLLGYEEIESDEKRIRLGGAGPGEASRLPELQQMLTASKQWFKATGKRPAVPSEADVAAALGVPALYQVAYRIASKSTHHSLIAMLNSFGGDFDGTKMIRPVPLHKKEPELAEQALIWAIITYAEFLERAEPVLKLGVAEPAHDIAYPWLEAHPWRVPSGASGAEDAAG